MSFENEKPVFPARTVIFEGGGSIRAKAICPETDEFWKRNWLDICPRDADLVRKFIEMTSSDVTPEMVAAGREALIPAFCVMDDDFRGGNDRWKEILSDVYMAMFLARK